MDVEANSFLRFYTSGAFFENFSVWMFSGTSKEQLALILNYPSDNNPIAGTQDHIFPPTESVFDLSEPFFHMATLTPLDGIRVVYSLLFRTQHKIEFVSPSLRVKDHKVEINANEDVILAIESKYLHPASFRTILMHLFNRLPSTHVMLEEELEVYRIPDVTITRTTIQLECLPFDISRAAEIGRFHQFIFHSLHVPNVLHLLIGLLCGRSVIVTSISPTQLSVGCFAMLSLLYPIQWPNVFITDIPSKLLDRVGSPVPFIIGIPFVLLSRDEVKESDIDMTFNLDFGFLLVNDEPQFDKLTKALISYTEKNLTDELEILKNTGVFPAYRIQLILWQFIIGLCLILTNQLDLNLAADNGIRQVIEKILDILASPKTAVPPLKRDSIRMALIDSPVVVCFAEYFMKGAYHDIEGRISDVARTMAPVQAMLRKTKV